MIVILTTLTDCKALVWSTLSARRRLLGVKQFLFADYVIQVEGVILVGGHFGLRDL